ncbi:MAG: BREX system Lon protease-like protein BrxL [Nitrososphaerota archaeon]
MELTPLDYKIRDIFPNESVFKEPKKSKLFSTLNIPSYMRDWIVKKFAKNEMEEIDLESVKEFIKEKIPRKKDLEYIKEKLINRQEKVEILAKIIVYYDISTGEALFELPELGLPEKKYQAKIENYLIEKYKNELLSPEGTWGIITLYWRIEYIPHKKKHEGRIICTNFKPFKPYKVNLQYFKDARKQFSLDEWIDVMLRSMDYNPAAFYPERSKIWMISRLLPFVEKRVNLIELAPKGTGKTYVYSQLSKYGWLVSGGSISRAKLFYDLHRKKPGLVSGYDFVALDEVDTISFPDKEEIQGALKGYLEYGEYRIGHYRGIGEAGIILLGNIPYEKQDENQFFLDTLPEVFKISALIDRFHGFIKGWEIPRMKEGMKAYGYGLNVEYFSEILHELRDEVHYRKIIDQVFKISKNADTRDIEAIKRISTGLLKLLFPHITSIEELSIEVFQKYCLKPAMEMREVIRRQLHLMDKEYSFELPDIQVKYK